MMRDEWAANRWRLLFRIIRFVFSAWPVVRPQRPPSRYDTGPRGGECLGQGRAGGGRSRRRSVGHFLRGMGEVERHWQWPRQGSEQEGGNQQKTKVTKVFPGPPKREPASGMGRNRMEGAG